MVSWWRAGRQGWRGWSVGISLFNTDPRFPPSLREGILTPQWSRWRGEVVFSYQPPSARAPTSLPLTPDPLDSRYVEVSRSRSRSRSTQPAGPPLLDPRCRRGCPRRAPPPSPHYSLPVLGPHHVSGPNYCYSPRLNWVTERQQATDATDAVCAKFVVLHASLGSFYILCPFISFV